MNRKEGTKHRKRKSNKLKILFWAILFAFVSVLILYLFSLGGENGIAEILNMRDYWLSVGVANGLILIGYLMMYRVDAQNIALNENDLEDTEWLSVKRLKKLKEFQVYDYKAADSKQDGIVIGAEKKGGNVEVITTSQLHALIVGTTGSGKTTGFVDQNIAVLGKSQSKPSIVISDPKKELYEKHAKNLEKQGYKISVLDLREPYSSERWNPMNVLLRRIRLVKDLENNLEQKDGKYYGAGEVFLSYRDARTRMQELKDEIYENAQDLVYTLCPVQNKDQPTWEQGARNLIFGFVLAMCEDCTHEAIIDRDTFDTVQKLREGVRRRVSIDGEMSIFSGLLYCADCGAKMYLNRHRGSEKDAFNCASYRKEKERTCTSHYITLHAIEDIVLYDLQRVLGMAKGQETEFVSMLQEKNKKMTKSDLSEKAKECDEAEKRIAVLDRIIQNLYEDKVSGTLSEERFIKLSKNYESEQAELTDKVKFLKEELMAVQKETADINKFMRLIKRYTEITELNAEIVRTFIDKIYVHKGEKAQGGHRQTIEIIYNCVGAIPEMEND